MGRSDGDSTDSGDDAAAAPTQRGGAVFAFAGLAAVAWALGAGVFVYLYLGVPTLLSLEPALQVALGLFILLPALILTVSGAAAREGVRARAEAGRLADAASRMLEPSPGIEASARRVGVAVRGEIEVLERAVDAALEKARTLETLMADQARTMEAAAAAAEAGAQAMLAGVARERAALSQIAEDLNRQAGLIGDSISRHTRLIADAARLAESEVRAADEALDARLSSFGAAAALISDRTGALSQAAQASAESTLRLESVLGGALDALTQASALTDAARQSAEAATFVAADTAGAVRDSTRAAVEDAKRVTGLIRQEAAAVEREAAAALERLKETALAAREAAEGARRAAATAPPQLPPDAALQNATQTARPARAAAPTPPAPPRRPIEPPSPPQRPRPAEPGLSETLSGVSPGRASPSPPPAPPPAPPSPPLPPEEDAPRWTWRDVLAAIDDERAPLSRPETSRPEAPFLDARPVRPRDPQTTPSPARDPEAQRGAPLALVEAAGLRLGEVFNLSTLDRIAQRSRNGAQARRRAVRDAAPEAVRRMADYLERDREARADANAFLRGDGVHVGELLSRGRASMSADATRAFLLIDTASA